MKRIATIFTTLAILLFCVISSSYAQDEPNVNTSPPGETVVDKPIEAEKPRKEELSDYFRSISVSVVTNNGEGTGVVFRDEFILTASHVVAYAYQNDKLIKVISPIYDWNNKQIGSHEVQAEIIKYSDFLSTENHDIAVLKLKEDIKLKNNAVVNSHDYFPKLAMEVWHCGSFFGKRQINSLVKGTVSSIGRIGLTGDEDEKEFDQLDIGAYPGSSGGGVYSADGKYIGMVQLMARGGSMFFMCPIRRIQKWAKEEKMEWLFDDSLPIPEDIKKIGRKPSNEESNLDFQKNTKQGNQKKSMYLFPIYLYPVTK